MSSVKLIVESYTMARGMWILMQGRLQKSGDEEDSQPQAEVIISCRAGQTTFLSFAYR